MSEIKLIEVPKWGLSMEEGTVTEWLVEEGASFSKGDLICEIETSKIANQLEAPFNGVLRRIVAKPGETLPVGAVLAVSAEAAVSDAEIEEFLAAIGADQVPTPAEAGGSPGGHPAPAQPTLESSPPSPAAHESVPVTETTNGSRQRPGSTIVPEALQGRTNGDVFATPHARRLADDLSIDLARVAGTGREGRISVADIHDTIRAAGGTVAPPVSPVRSGVPGRSFEDDSTVPATPVARRLAASLGINLHDCRATGSRGRVCESDVREAERRFRLQPEVGAAPEPAAEAEFETIPFTTMRKAIGQRLQQSKRNAPHFRLTTDLQIDDLLALRKEINATVPAVKLSVNDFIVKACAAALQKVPDVNIQFDEATQSVLRYARADISVAVALPSGLITPIVRNADGKTLAEISGEVQSLVTKAKTGKLTADEFQGGTFTVSNLGMFDVRKFDAIINPPQGAILAVGAGQERPVVVDGQVVARTMLTVTLSCDHRVIDGALGAAFLRELRRFVESPALMLV
ncbi:diaminohydroxyphosphoribosylaminopyrimidine deaminase [Rhodococcus pyridinivorans SB3094]|uniref:Dihydrolipoamide acetyltransferase component of pyruvate dehydrogenase complex n=1 Tax=Rhodococcus pyridinivorans SB3094 TaxID=1435356 RepID=V9XDD0_9NOCA|nr:MULTISPECIES: 2-oxo acid dehydrogenase subunit E2 [Rhodococcus]AHD21446.1 diaminohydroxyphosphoribosylaminopyrimidine deaminase [Rhodococcus pyridinivorans SB3094]MCT7291056.1 2-oxo acid dehydrogenase subunit E2 [Rhodococcus sp. PAE-6]